MEFLPAQLDTYITANSEPEPEVLTQLNRETWSDVLVPRMLCGHLQGRVLSMLSHMIQPHIILEIGTYTGYSAICLAEGLADGGHLHTIEINEELTEITERYFREAGVTDKITQHIGNAMEIIPGIDSPIDLVFIDADKNNYSNYFDLVIDRLSSGGYIIADNVLWSGKVIDEKEISQDLDTRSLVSFSAKVQADQRVQNVLFPVRDGLMVCRKL